MSTITVTIGRNVGDVPMTEERWEDFTTKVDRAVAEACDDIWQRAVVHAGNWKGNPELACTWVADPWHDDTIGPLRLALRVLAGEFDQDAIALTIGRTELVEPFAPGTYGNPSRD